MSEAKAATHSLFELATGPSTDLAVETHAKIISASIDQARMLQTYWVGMCRYILRARRHQLADLRRVEDRPRAAAAAQRVLDRARSEERSQRCQHRILQLRHRAAICVVF